MAPQGQKQIKKITRDTSLKVPRQRRPSQYQSWGPKLPHVQNLGGGFVVFFLGGQNRNFEKVWGAKTAIKPNNYDHLFIL